MPFTTMSPKEDILAALERMQTTAFILSLVCVALGFWAIFEHRGHSRVKRELERVDPEIRNFDAGYRAGQHDGLALAGRLSIFDIHTGVCGSQIIRVLGIPDSVKIETTLPTGEPSSWTWKYGDVTLVLRYGPIDGEEYLIGHSGPLRELVEAKKAEREPKLDEF